MVTSSNSSTLSNKWLINLSIICIIILFISLNTLSNQLFNSARIDLTQDNLYTLNQSTYEVIENIDEPITLRLFFFILYLLLYLVFANLSFDHYLKL